MRILSNPQDRYVPLTDHHQVLHQVRMKTPADLQLHVRIVTLPIDVRVPSIFLYLRICSKDGRKGAPEATQFSWTTQGSRRAFFRNRPARSHLQSPTANIFKNSALHLKSNPSAS